MKKILFTIFLCGVLVLELTGCRNSENEIASIRLEDINLKIQEYFSDETKDHSNLSYNYVDTEKNVVVVGLINNNELEQEEFLNNIFDLKDIETIKSKSLIDFRRSDENTTSNLPKNSVEEKINSILKNGPLQSSNPFDYVHASEEVYDELLDHPKETFEYAMKDLMETNASGGLKSYIEALLCSEINQNFEYDFESGMDYIEHYKKFLIECDCLYNDYDRYTQSLLK